MKWKREERRRAIRMQFPYTINISVADQERISTYTEDISDQGVMVVIRKKLDLLSPLDLEIYIQKKPVTCKGKVTWVKEKEAFCLEDVIFFNTGIEFYEIKEADKKLIKRCLERLGKDGKKKGQEER
ncbi:MAG: PilZ domain-containing protein [Candidatus Omnitrophota bacterium]|nr:MAG: PilZ domain-containing protein [Candidatus Omnitrophota bacterium]